MDIHFWDMDGTLVDGDVDTSWKEYLIDKGLAAPDAKAQTDYYYEQYCRGELDQDAFSRFQHAEFAGRDEAEMSALARDHIASCIQSRLYPEAVRWVKRQQAQGQHLILLTATSRVLAEPVAAFLDIKTVLATELALRDGRYTGEYEGVYCGGAGKVATLKPYLAAQGTSIENAYYYGDSMADVPVFEAVGHPIVCNPGDPLRKIAQDRDWPIHDFANTHPRHPGRTQAAS